MSTPASVLSHLALSFSAHPENLATEALNFVLGRSAAARNAMGRIAATFGLSFDGDLTYATQISDAIGARPDLVGRTADQRTRLLVEAKFWAGLTDNQPVGYLRSFDGNSSGCLLFVAPAERLETLWTELQHRVIAEGLNGGPVVTHGPQLRCMSVGKDTLALVSWRALLDALLTAVQAVHDEACIADIRQLLALTEQMDSTAFLPLHSEELTGSLGRRVVQFGALAEDLTRLVLAKGFGDAKGLKASGSNGYYGRYLRIKGHAAFIHFSAKNWAQWGESPLWLGLMGPDWKYSAAVSGALRMAGLHFHQAEAWCYLSLPVPVNVERDAVIADALAHLLKIASAIPDLSAVSHPTLPGAIAAP